MKKMLLGNAEFANKRTLYHQQQLSVIDWNI